MVGPPTVLHGAGLLLVYYWWGPWATLLPAMLLLYRVYAKMVSVKQLGRGGDLSVIIVGAGVSGLCMGKKLKDRSVNFTILESGGELGGTWRDNTYPGCGCDVPSHLYSYSFFPNPGWSRVYSGQREILDYLRRMAERFELVSHIKFGRKVTDCTWDAEECKWKVATEGGETFTTRVLVSGSGALHVPHTPNLPGAHQFGGAAMHTARWDSSYSPAGKRIAVVGTGASAVQAMPELAKTAERVTVFQRTPCWSPRKYDSLYPAWLRATFEHLPASMALLRLALFLRNELFFHALIATDRWYSDWLSKLVHKQVRRNVTKVVKDPETAAKLTPSYALGCKRITPSDSYWKMFNSANVELVTEPITALCEEGVKAGEETYQVDTIIYATGFDLLSSGYAFEITNKYGKSAREEFGAAPQGYLGICHPSYPSFYWLLGPGTGLGTNSIIYMIECQADFVVWCLARMEGQGGRALHVKEEALADYQAWTNATMKERIFGGRGTCDAWYKNSAGYNWTLWPSDCLTYWWSTRSPNPDHFALIK